MSSKEEKDQVILVANPTRYPSQVAGAIKGRCTTCRQEVWIAPSSLLAEYESIACLDCVLASIEKREADSGNIQAPNPEQRAEWKRETGTEYPDQDKIMELIKKASKRRKIP